MFLTSLTSEPNSRSDPPYQAKYFFSCLCEVFFYRGGSDPCEVFFYVWVGMATYGG